MRGPVFILCLLLLASCNKDKRVFTVSKIKSASKLATMEATIDKVILGSQDKRLLGIITLNSAYFAAHSQAVVKAGVDLNKLKPGDVKIDGKRIELQLPGVEVLDFAYPFDRYHIDSSITQNAFLNKMDIMDHEELYRQAEMDIRENLEYLGLKSATQQKTRLLMEGLLKNLGYEEIYISFKEDQFIKPINTGQQEL